MKPDTSCISVEREICQEIMHTDVFIKIIGEKGEMHRLKALLDESFQFFRDFEQRFSRFRETSELTQFNKSQGGKVSPDLFALLHIAKKYSLLTQGIFDPAILPALESAGYGKNLMSEDTHLLPSHSIQELEFDATHTRITKPRSLKIDLGGIGKGYCVDMVSQRLRSHGCVDFVVDAGGDIFASGVNREEGYPYWAFDIEDPFDVSHSCATILLTNEAVATSGRNRRTWIKDGLTKHHLIHPVTRDSANSSFMTVSVIAPTTTAADVWAKTLFLLDSEGLQRAHTQSLPALFITTTGAQHSSPLWDTKTWPSASPHLQKMIHS